MIRPGGYSGLCSVNAIELSFGCVLAFRAVVRCYTETIIIKEKFLKFKSLKTETETGLVSTLAVLTTYYSLV